MRRYLLLFLCFSLIFCFFSCSSERSQQTSERAAESVVPTTATDEEISTVLSDSEEPESVSEETGTSLSDSEESESISEETQPMEEASPNILVAYFSRTGNTKPLAEYAAESLGADLYEIVAAIPYTEADINYHDSQSRTSIEQNDVTARPEIEGSVDRMEQYDVVILAYPIWWGQAPRIISTFLESYDFSGKTILPFCTSASSGIGSSAENLHSLVSETAHWLDGKRFAAGTDQETLTAWLSGMLSVDETEDTQ